MNQRWEALFAQAFADFPDARVLQEARKVLEAMDYKVQQNDTLHVIPQNAPLAVVRRSLHSDDRMRSGGFLAFDVAVGPHFTDQGIFNGVCEYGIMHLEFGLDGAYQDDHFIVSPLLASPEAAWEYEQTATMMRVLAEKAQYNEKSKRGNG